MEFNLNKNANIKNTANFNYFTNLNCEFTEDKDIKYFLYVQNLYF